MPREEDTADNQPNINGNDRAAEVAANAELPPLVSYMQRQLRHLGEGAGRLARWVTGRNRRAITVSPVGRWPALSRAFDFIRSKAIVDSPVWRRTLDLPWFPGRSRRRRRPALRSRDIAAREPGMGQRPEGLGSVDLFRSPEDTEEEPSYDEAAETYPLEFEQPSPRLDTEMFSPHQEGRSYPALNAKPFSPPSLGRMLPESAGDSPSSERRLPKITGDFPTAAGSPARSLRADKISEKHYLKENIGPRLFPAKQEITHAAGETHPAILKTLSKPSEAGMGLPDAARENLPAPPAPFEYPDTGRPVVNDAEVRAGAASRVPQNEPTDRAITPENYRRIPGADTAPTGTSGERPAGIVRPQLTHLGQKVSRLLRPLTQRITRQIQPLEIRLQTAGKHAGESPPHGVPGIAAAVRPIARSIPPIHSGIGPDTSAALPSESVSTPKWSPAPGETLKTTGLSPAPGRLEPYAKKVTDTVLPGATDHPQRARAPSGKASPRTILGSDKSRQQAAPVPPSPPWETPKSGAADHAESQTGRDRELDDIGLDTPRYQYIGMTLPGGRMNSTILSMAPSPGRRIVREPAPELPLVTRLAPEARYSGGPGEELTANMHPSIPEMTAFRYPNAPDMALAPADGPASTASSATSSRAEEAEASGTEEGGEPESEPGASPDLDAIARDVYRILKRRLMAERERALGVY